MSSHVPLGPQSIFCLMACLWSVAATAQVLPFDPYAEFQEAPPPVLPDGTLHWGTCCAHQHREHPKVDGLSRAYCCQLRRFLW